MSEPEEEFAVDLRRYTVGGYRPGPFLKRACWLLVSGLIFETRVPWPSDLKSALLRAFGATVGVGVIWKPSVKVKYPWFLTVGDYCWIGEKVWIDNVLEVTIGDHAILSQSSLLLTGNHDYKSPAFDLRAEPIYIGDGAWIAARAIVCPGVRVERLAVLTVNSVASADLKGSGVYAGNPAKLIRMRSIEIPSGLETEST